MMSRDNERIIDRTLWGLQDVAFSRGEGHPDVPDLVRQDVHCVLQGLRAPPAAVARLTELLWRHHHVLQTQIWLIADGVVSKRVSLSDRIADVFRDALGDHHAQRARQ